MPSSSALAARCADSRPAARTALSWLLLVLLWPLSLWSPNAAANSSHGSSTLTGPPPVPLLWRVSDGRAQLYLVGSFHLLRADDYPLAADLERAFAQSQRLLFELAPDELNSAELARQLWQAGQREGGSSLSQELGEVQWSRLQAYCRQRGLSLPALQRQRPWLAALSIELNAMAGHGLDPAIGLDRHLMARATASGKSTAGLETGHEQIALFSGLAPSLQRQMLVAALDAAERGDSYAARLHAAWRAGDAEQLTRLLAQPMRLRDPELYRRINSDRNRRWLPRLEQLLDSEPQHGVAMVVVGALHLLGKDGLIERLRARGYEVERLGLSAP